MRIIFFFVFRECKKHQFGSLWAFSRSTCVTSALPFSWRAKLYNVSGVNEAFHPSVGSDDTNMSMWIGKKMCSLLHSLSYDCVGNQSCSFGVRAILMSFVRAFLYCECSSLIRSLCYVKFFYRLYDYNLKKICVNLKMWMQNKLLVYL